MTSRGRRWLMAMGWLSALFRLPALFANSLHSDEALFASWARLIATWRDPLLRGQPVDKPPLLFYLQAVFYPLQGPVEWAARLPGFIVSILLVPLLGMLVWKLYRDELSAVIAALLQALSPLAIQFSATAFTDPLLAAGVIATLYSVVRARNIQSQSAMAGRATGFYFGMAIAIKHQAWLFLPLVLGLAVINGWQGGQWRQALLGLIPWLSLLLLWDVTRTGRLTLWSTQVSNFGGIRPAWSWELATRWDAWLGLWRWIIASPPLLLLFPLTLWPFRNATGLQAAANRLVFLFLTGYFALHWLLAFPTWDRYLLPVVPLVTMLLGWTISQLLRAADAYFRPIGRPESASLVLIPAAESSRRLMPLLLLALLLIQLPTAAAARQGAFPIGGQPTADQGAAAVALLLAEAPYGTVLYDHWFSWQWRYHLLDSRVYVSWFPQPDALVADLIGFAGGGQPRYLALPSSDVARPVRRAVAEAGFHLLRVANPDPAAIDLYQIVTQGASGE